MNVVNFTKARILMHRAYQFPIKFCKVKLTPNRAVQPFRFWQILRKCFLLLHVRTVKGAKSLTLAKTISNQRRDEAQVFVVASFRFCSAPTTVRATPRTHTRAIPYKIQSHSIT